MAHTESVEAIISKKHQELTEQEKSSYIQLCKQAIIKHVKDTTKESSGVEFGEINVHAETLIPQINYTVENGFEFSIVPDRMPPSSRHTLIADKDEMLARMSIQQQNDLNSNDIRANVENSLATSDYGAISDTAEIYSNPMMWLYHFQCDQCNGRGSHQCLVCHGHGRTNCHKCGGDGRIRCIWCKGSGRHASGSVCDPCHGTGIMTCDNCHGRGSLTCSRCGGTGQLKCEHCAGTGWLTTIGRTFIKPTPSYSINYLNSAPKFCKTAIEKIGISHIHRYTVLRRYDSYREQNDAFSVRYIGRLIAAEAEVKIKGKNSKWLLGGHNVSVIDAGGAMDNIMEDKISELTNCRVSLLNPWGDARKRIANFMSYDINHKIIEASLDDDNPRVIRNWLSNSVSEQYISDSMAGLASVFEMVKDINSWLFAILFAILPCVIAYFIRPVYIKLEPGYPSSFMNSLPFIIVAMGVPAFSACLITWLLNKWYNSKNKDLLRVWSKQRNLLMKVPFTQNISIAAGHSAGDSIGYFTYCLALTLPGITTYIWTLSMI